MPLVIRENAPPVPDLSRLANPEHVDVGAETAILIVHGFTATPAGMTSLVAPLVAQGYSVHVPLLPGHGTHPFDLDRIRWRAWVTFVQAEYRTLCGRYSRVCVVGQSLGAVLCRLLFAERRPPDAAVLLAMPWRIADPVGRCLLPLFNLTPLKYRIVRTKDGGPDIADPAARTEAEQSSYPWTTMAPLCELNKLFALQRRTIGLAPCPTLLMHSRQDHVAEYHGAERLANVLGKNARLETLENSFHVLTQDLEREAVAARVKDYLSSDTA